MELRIVVSLLLIFLFLLMPLSFNLTAQIVKKQFIKSIPAELAERLERGEPVRVIILLKNGTERRGFLIKRVVDLRDRLKEDLEASDSRLIYEFKSLPGAVAVIRPEFIDRVMFDPYFRLEPDRKLKIMVSDTIPLIQADLSWERGIKGQNQTICILDTGIDYTHPDLGGCTQAGFLAGNCSKVIGGWDFVNQDADPMDDHGHGTHCAGIAAGNGTLKGVAPEARLIAIKVLDSSGSGYLSDIVSGIDWCVSNRSRFNISVISMSLGTSDWHASSPCDSAYPSLTQAIDRAVGENITVVVATGNEYKYTAISLPACISNSTRVTATDKHDQLADFANRASGFPDILAAPGVSVNSTVPGGYTLKSGTSMATPHVAGAIALLQQACQLARGHLESPGFLEERLNLTGKPVPDPETGMNWSRISVWEAVDSILPPRITIISPENRSYNSSRILFNVSLDENGTAWLELSENLTMNFSQGYWWREVELQDGVWTARIWANDTAGNVNSSQVSFRVDTFPPNLTLVSPENRSYPGKVRINYTVDEGKCNWTLGNLTGNTSGQELNLSEGFYCFKISCQDEAGNRAEAERYFTVDFPPRILILSPENKSYNTSQIWLKTEINDSVECWWELSGQNHTFNCSQALLQLQDGNWTLKVWANDTAGNLNSSQVSFRVDTQPPRLEVVSPENRSYRKLEINYTVEDADLKRVFYLLNGSEGNLTGNITLELSDGYYCLEIAAEDRAGNRNSTLRCFWIDTQPPLINLSFLRVGILDQNFTISVSSDGSCNLTVIYPNSSQTRIEGWFVPDQAGIYNLSVTCQDEAGNNRTVEDWFEIEPGTRLNLTGNLSFLLILPETGETVYNLSQSSQVPNRTWNARILTDRGVEMNLTDFRPGGLELKLERMDGERERIYAVELRANYSNITISLNASGVGDPEHLAILYCQEWNFSQDTCITGWREIQAERRGNSFIIQHLSAFKIYQEPYCGDGICQPDESCSTCPQDCGSCPKPRSWGGGGGGGYLPEIRKPEVNVSWPEGLTVFANESGRLKIGIKASERLNFTLGLETDCNCSIEFPEEFSWKEGEAEVRISNCSIQTCNINLTLESEVGTSTASVLVKIKPVCPEGKQECRGDEIWSCDGYGWKLVQKCERCVNGTCVQAQAEEKVPEIPWGIFLLVWAMISAGILLWIGRR